jgi:tetratricopeptide (TPR) repeat protein
MQSEAGSEDTASAASPIDRWLPALILAVVFAAYFPSLFGTWVWDDIPQYRDNPAITDPWVLVTHDVWGPTGHAQPSNLPIYRPLAMLSHAPGQSLLRGPFVERALNLLLHLLIVIGVARFARRLGASQRAAWFGAACLGVHPALTESVAWISCRGELMGAGLVLAGTLAFAKQRDFAAGILLALAPFCKETFVLAPVSIAIWMLALRRFSAPVLGLSALGALGYLVIRTQLDIAMPSGGPVLEPTTLLGSIGAVAVRGLALFTVPTAPDALPAFVASPWAGGLALLIAIPAFMWLPGRPWLASLLATLPLLALAAPASLSNGVVSDRYFLVAAIGLGVAAAFLYASVESKHRWAPALAIVPILWLPFTTLRASDWMNGGELFSASLLKNPENHEAEFHLGYYLHTSQDDCEAAIPFYARARHENIRAGNNLQACLLTLKRPQDAAEIGPDLAAADPDNPTPALNTARALTQLGELSQAEVWAREGIGRSSPSPSSIVLLGNIVGMQGRHAQAQDIFERALALEPGSAAARLGLEQARRNLAAAS